MRGYGKITALVLGACCTVFAAGPLRGQTPSARQALQDSLRNPATAPGAEAMRFDRTHLNAGRMSEDDAPAAFTFRFRNEGDRPLVITRVQTTCGCAVATYGKQPVRTGGEGEVTVTYHPKGHPGSFERRIFVFTQLSARYPTAVLTLSGTVTPSVLPTHDYPYAMGPLLLKQQEVRILGKRIQTERIECLNAGDKPLRLTAESDLLPAGFVFECDPETIAPGTTGDLVIRFDPAVAAERLPRQLPLILRGIDLPPSQRTVRIRIGTAE